MTIELILLSTNIGFITFNCSKKFLQNIQLRKACPDQRSSTLCKIEEDGYCCELGTWSGSCDNCGIPSTRIQNKCQVCVNVPQTRCPANPKIEPFNSEWLRQRSKWVCDESPFFL